MRRALVLLALIALAAGNAWAGLEGPASLDADTATFINFHGEPFTLRAAFYNQPDANTTYVLSEMDLDLAQDDLAELAADGFNALALIVPWGEVLTSVEPGSDGAYGYDAQNLDKLEALLDLAADAGLYAVLSLCTVDRLPQGARGVNFTARARMTDSIERAAFIDSISTIAARLADHPALLIEYLSIEAMSLSRWDYVLSDPANLAAFREWLADDKPSALYWLERWGEPTPECADPTDEQCWSYVTLPSSPGYSGSPWALDPAWDKVELFHRWHEELLIDLLDDALAALRTVDPEVALGFLGRSNILECDPNPAYDPAHDPDADWLPQSATSRGRELPNPGDDPGVYCREIVDDSALYAALESLGFDLAAWAYFPQRRIEAFGGDRPPLEWQLRELLATHQWLLETSSLPLYCEELGARSERDLPDGGREELLVSYAATLDLQRNVGAALWTWRDDLHVSSPLNDNPALRRLGEGGQPLDVQRAGSPLLIPILGYNNGMQPYPMPVALVDDNDFFLHSAAVAPGVRLRIEITTLGTRNAGSGLWARIDWLDQAGALLGNYYTRWPEFGAQPVSLVALSDPAPERSALAVLSVGSLDPGVPVALIAAAMQLPYSDWGLRDVEGEPKPVLWDESSDSDLRRINAANP
ncbi:MAG: cellulase family glycosylhydrolase [Candidatus Alcyoniella australis]|nr:cellulase family glycosylhydrolase [Candidatus Alcyoniella australis]